MVIPTDNPGKLLQISGNYWKTCTLHAAVKLDLFSLIRKRQATADSIGQLLNADTDSIERLLNALCAMGLLNKIDNLYENTQTSLKYLVIDSPDYIGWMILHHHHLVQSWSRLDQAVITGKPQRESSVAAPEKWREAFLKGMQTNAKLHAAAVVSAVDLSERENLLDLGGGPGTYAIHFCKANPGLFAVVFDLPASQPIAEENINSEGLADRIRFQGGDYHEDPIEGRFDVAWLSHILHAEGPESCREIIAKAGGALKPGGVILIHEFILNDNMDGPEFPALFSLNMLVGTTSGRSYSESQLKEMLSSAGFRSVRRLPFRGPTDSGILIGVAD